MNARAVRAAHLVEATWGMTLLIAPARVIRLGKGSDAEASEVLVARVLGARHLAQAAAIVERPSRSRLLLGSVVNALHALSLGLVGAVDDSRRRLCGCDAAVAALWCTVEVLLSL